MNLKDVKPSRNFVDVSFSSSSDDVIQALFDAVDPYKQVEGGAGPGKNSYGKYLNEWFQTLKPEDLESMKRTGISFEDLAFIDALRRHGPSMLDYKFRRLYMNKGRR